MSTNQSAAEQEAVKVLAVEAEPWVSTLAAALVAGGTHQWIFDPQVDGPIGLVRTGTTYALVIVYPGERPDFECSDEFESMAAPKEV